MGQSPAVRVEGFTKDFGTVRAVDDVTFEVPRGAVFGFLGPNGAGKSTAIRLLLGLLEPTSGRALVAGFDPGAQGDEVRARCGVLLDQTGLYDRLSAEQNLEFYARVWGMPAADSRERVTALLEHIGLADRRREPVAAAAALFAWAVGIAVLVVSLVAVTIRDDPGAPSVLEVVSAVAGALLIAAAMASLGVLLSLRASSGQSAQQAMALTLAAGGLGLAAIAAALPSSWKGDLEDLAANLGDIDPGSLC